MSQKKKKDAKSNKYRSEVSEKESIVEIKSPAKISINLVQANEIRHYGIFSFIASMFLSAAVGFWTASFNIEGAVLKWVAGVFSVFSLGFWILAVVLWKKAFCESVKKFSRVSSFE